MNNVYEFIGNQTIQEVMEELLKELVKYGENYSVKLEDKNGVNNQNVTMFEPDDINSQKIFDVIVLFNPPYIQG